MNITEQEITDRAERSFRYYRHFVKLIAEGQDKDPISPDELAVAIGALVRGLSQCCEAQMFIERVYEVMTQNYPDLDLDEMLGDGDIKDTMH